VPGTIKTSSITYGTETVYLKDNGNGILQLVRVSNDSVIVASAGTLDYATGSIMYSLPAAAKVAGFENSTSGSLQFMATPAVPDINTNLNNIVRIASTKVVSG